MFVARGKYLLFADADGASKFSDLSKLEKNLTSTKNADNMAVICGSRAHLEQDSIAEVWYYNKPNSLKLGFMSRVVPLTRLLPLSLGSSG